MSQELYELPERWEWSDLNSACSLITDGAHASPKTQLIGKPYITVRDIDKMGNIDLVGCKKISDDDFDSLTKGKCSPSEGSVLFSKDGTVGKVALVKNYDPFVVLSSLAILDPKSDLLTSEYLRWFMLSPELQGNAIGKKTGAAIKRIVLRTIKTMEIPLPPLHEQKRIVAKLDALFTRIDTATTHLQQTLELSKALFASALDSALVPTGNIDALPESWSCEVLQTVSNLVSDGTHHSPKEQFHDKQDGLYKYVTSKNIKFDGLKLDNVTYIRKEVHDDIYARCNPEYLDQLITKDGAMTGTCCLNTLDEPFSLLSSVALVKLKRKLMLPHFLNYFLQSPTGQELMIGDISGAAITRTNLKKLKAIKVPLPPIKEQQRIVSHLNSLSERSRTLKASTQEKINDLTALKASLLDAAFKGQL